MTLVKGWLDLKTGKSSTGWSLIDRGARFEGKAAGLRQHYRRWWPNSKNSCTIWYLGRRIRRGIEAMDKMLNRD
jgi:hypothetical protein